MPRFADPTTCPDCRTALPAAPAQCPTCRLPLRGPGAAALFATLVRADELLAALRSSTGPAGHGPAPVGPVAYATSRSGLRGASVPRVLLGLGAACLLVAAITFLAVAWAGLGVEGRTAVLVVLTLSAATAGVALARRGLSVGAEALSTVALGLVALDVLGARTSGWLGGLGTSGTTAVVGAAVLVAGLGLAATTHRRPHAPVAAQLGAALGLLLAGVGAAAATGHLTTTATVTVLAATGLAASARRIGLALLTDAAAVVGATWWLGLTAAGLADAVDDPSLAGLWLDGAGAGLVCAALLTLLLLAPPTPAGVRHHALVGPAVAGVAGLLVTLLAVLPLLDETGGALLTGCLAGLAGWTVVAALAPRRGWAAAAAAPQLLLGLPAALVTLDLLGAALANLARAGDPATAPVDVTLGSPSLVASPLLLVPAACVLALATAVHLPAAQRRRGAVAAVATTVPAAVAALATQPVPLGAVVLAAVLPALVGTLLGLRRGGATGATLATGSAALAAVATAVALPSAALTALVLVPVTALAGLLALAPRASTALLPHAHRAAAPAAVVLPLLAGVLGWSVADVSGLTVADRALPVLLVVGLLAVALPRTGPEAAAALVGLVATVTALEATLADPATSVTGAANVALALHLTLAGALVTASALVHPARRHLAWPGGLLLAAATWVRLADLGVTAPEAYTLPSALVLVAVGLRRLHRDPDASTRAALLPGLVLATVPSLLTVLAGDPVSVRALLLGTGCLVLVLAGVRVRWSAPVGVGAAVGTVLLVAELAPYAAATPQWLLIGAAGLLLTAAGVTWEDRTADARRAAGYLVRLR